MGPKSLTNLFTYKSEVRNYKLRNISSSLCLPQPRTNNMKNSFMYDGAQLWNYILKEIREQIRIFLSKENRYSHWLIEIATQIDS
jgi:hypothetical protein